jgi:hypothetical protein
MILARTASEKEMDRREREFKMVLEHLAEGLTFEQIGAKYGISTARAHQIYVGVLARLGISGKPNAASVGLAIQRWAANNTRDRGIMDTPEWFHVLLKHEREEDERNAYYRNLD